MWFFHNALALLGASSLPLVHAQVSILSNVTTPSLNLTTITARNGNSILQCWAIPGFVASSTAGTSGALDLFLGNVTNSSFTVLPPRFDGGVHRSPTPQFVYFTSGLAHITLPNMTTPESSAWIQGGKNGLILALDTQDVSEYGHITIYPSASDTVGLQIPFSAQGYEGLLARKRVLYDGGCKEQELVGI